MDNAADPKKIKEKSDRDRRLKEDRENDLRELLALPGFRRYVWRHVHETCKVMESAFNPNGSVQSLNLGMQSVGVQLWKEVEAIDPEIIPTMMIEYHRSVKQ